MATKPEAHSTAGKAAAEDAAAPPKKSKRLFIIGGGAAALLAALGGTVVVIKKRQSADDEDEEAPAVPGSRAKPKKHLSSSEIAKAEEARVWVQYSNIVTNLLAGSGVAQATVEVQVSDSHVKERLEKVRPLVLAKILDMFLSIPFTKIVDPSTKAQLAQMVKTELNTILGGSAEHPDVHLVVFSTFIAQQTDN